MKTLYSQISSMMRRNSSTKYLLHRTWRVSILIMNVKSWLDTILAKKAECLDLSMAGGRYPVNLLSARLHRYYWYYLVSPVPVPG